MTPVQVQLLSWFRFPLFSVTVSTDTMANVFADVALLAASAGVDAADLTAEAPGS